jgi:hypothetical protein
MGRNKNDSVCESNQKNSKSNIIKGKIQHDQTFAVAAATANQYNMCNVAKSKQENRVAKKLGVWLEVG